MFKKIEFFRVVYDFLPMDALNKTEEQLKNCLTETILDSINPRDQHQSKISESSTSSVLIEIIDIENDHLFGVIGKLEDLKDGILKRFRSKDDKTIISSSEDNIDYYIENYTYFYVRFNDLLCAVLTNTAAPRFRTHFTNYLNKKTSALLLEQLAVINVFDDNINYKINKIVDLIEVKLLFDDSSIMGNRLLNLDKTFHLSQSSIKEAKVELSLKMNPISNETKRIFKDNDLMKSDFKRIELLGIDEDEEEIELELIEKLLTKRVFIDIDERYLRSSSDLNKIKEALVKALPII